jgi:hypothetical protein
MLCFALVGGAALIAQARTTISLEILGDGTCSVAVRGADARSEMSYRPQAPGRCPIPSTRDAGAVRVEVLLPRGSVVPRRSIPALEWTMVEGRPRGVAELEAAPEFVDIMPATRPAWSRAAFVVLLLIAAAAAAWAFARGRIQRRSA